MVNRQQGTAIDHADSAFFRMVAQDAMPANGSLDRRVDDSAVEEVDVTSAWAMYRGLCVARQTVAPSACSSREHLHQRLAALRIEVARRLVGEQDGRPAGDGAGDGDELLVTA